METVETEPTPEYLFYYQLLISELKQATVNELKAVLAFLRG